MNKLLVIGLAEDMKENRENLDELLKLLELGDEKFHLSADLKLINLLLGISTHSSTHPCPHCKWRRNTFGKGDLRTFEEIREFYIAWQDSGKTATSLNR